MLSLPVLLVSTVLCGTASAQPDLDNAVIDFSTTWCGPCREMSPLVSKLERDGLPIHKIDVDHEKALANRKYTPLLRTTRAAAVFVPNSFKPAADTAPEQWPTTWVPIAFWSCSKATRSTASISCSLEV